MDVTSFYWMLSGKLMISISTSVRNNTTHLKYLPLTEETTKSLFVNDILTANVHILTLGKTLSPWLLTSQQAVFAPVDIQKLSFWQLLPLNGDTFSLEHISGPCMFCFFCCIWYTKPSIDQPFPSSPSLSLEKILWNWKYCSTVFLLISWN